MSASLSSILEGLVGPAASEDKLSFLSVCKDYDDDVPTESKSKIHSSAENRRHIFARNHKLSRFAIKKLPLPFIYQDLSLADLDQNLSTSNTSSKQAKCGASNKPSCNTNSEHVAPRTLSLDVNVIQRKKTNSTDVSPGSANEDLTVKRHLRTAISLDPSVSNQSALKSVRFSTHLQQFHNQPHTKKKTEKSTSASLEESCDGSWFMFAGDRDLNQEAISIDSFEAHTHSSDISFENQESQSPSLVDKKYNQLPSDEEFQQGILFRCKYVGSMNLLRPGSRAEILSAMRKVRSDCKNRHRKKKPVLLLISVDGVKAVTDKKPHASTKNWTDESDTILFDHIYNIFYVSHDSQDNQVFSYISRSSNMGKSETIPDDKQFFCHVFKASRKLQAVLIVQSLGRVFEICSQIALTIKRSSSPSSAQPTLERHGSCIKRQLSQQPSNVSTAALDGSEYTKPSYARELEETEKLLARQAITSPQQDQPPRNIPINSKHGYEDIDIPILGEVPVVDDTVTTQQQEILLLWLQLEQQEQQIAAAVSQTELLRQQVAIETQSRNDAEFRCHQLLLHNKDLLEHINRLANENRELRERGDLSNHPTINQPVMSSSSMSNSQTPVKQSDHESLKVSPDSGHKEMSTKTSISGLFDEWEARNASLIDRATDGKPIDESDRNEADSGTSYHNEEEEEATSPHHLTPVLPHKKYPDASTLLKTLMLSDSEKKLYRPPLSDGDVKTDSIRNSMSDIYGKMKAIRRSLENMESLVNRQLIGPVVHESSAVLCEEQEETPIVETDRQKLRHAYENIVLTNSTADYGTEEDKHGEERGLSRRETFIIRKGDVGEDVLQSCSSGSTRFSPQKETTLSTQILTKTSSPLIQPSNTPLSDQTEPENIHTSPKKNQVSNERKSSKRIKSRRINRHHSSSTYRNNKNKRSPVQEAGLTRQKIEAEQLGFKPIDKSCCVINGTIMSADSLNSKSD